MKPKASDTPELKFAKPGSAAISASEFVNRTQTEATLQSQCNEFLQYYPDIRVIRLPDSLWRVVYAIRSSALQGILAACLGGLPDLMLFKRGDKYNSCLAIELKVKGRKLRRNQLKWANAINVYKVEQFEDFERIFKEWLSENRASNAD